jgi:hypothetical protein
MTAYAEDLEEEHAISMDRRTPEPWRGLLPWAPFILTLVTLIAGWVLGIGRTDAATGERLRQMENRVAQLELSTVKKDEYNAQITGLQGQLNDIRDDTHYVRTRLDLIAARRQ